MDETVGNKSSSDMMVGRKWDVGGKWFHVKFGMQELVLVEKLLEITLSIILTSYESYDVGESGRREGKRGKRDVGIV